MATESAAATERERRLGEVLAAWIEAAEAGRAPDSAVWLAQHPDLTPELTEFLATQKAFGVPAGPREVVTQPAGGGGPPLPSFGDYEVAAELGRGGMGTVYRARQVSLGRVVALKVLHEGPATDRKAVRRFRNEAELIAGLDHPNIVPIYEVGENDGRLYFTMRLLEGGSLAGHLARFQADPKAAARLVAAVARAVHHAHQRGVLHRDLKPSNILLDGAGAPHVTDFGLARRVQTDSALTQSGAIVGTPSYMAPEQTVGDRLAVTTAADVYGLGGVLYALLTGRPPFHGETILDTMTQAREAAPEPPSRRNRKVGRDLETICLKCLEKEPARRYASAEALAEDLERFLNVEPIQARRPTLSERAAKWARRHPAMVWATVIVLVVTVPVLAASTAWAWHKQRQTEDARQVADQQHRTAQSSAEDAERQRRRADENLRQVVAIVNSMVYSTRDREHIDQLLAQHTTEALKFFERLVAEERSDPEGRLQVALAYRGIGHIWHARSEYTKAADAYVRALAITRDLAADSPDDPRYGKLRNDLLLDADRLVGSAVQRGDDFTGERKLVEAVKRYREGLSILERFPDYDQAWNPPIQKIHRQSNTLLHLAYALWASDQLGEAEDVSTEAMAAYTKWAADPNNKSRTTLEMRAIAQERRGFIRAESGRLADAESDFRQVLEFWDRPSPVERIFTLRRIEVRNALGNLLWATGRREGATALFRQAEEEWRKTNYDRNELAWFLAACPDEQFRNPKEAVELAEKAVKTSPTFGVYWRTLGVARYRAGDARGAVAALEKSLELGINTFGNRNRPDSSEWFFLAMAHWRLGDKEQARKWYDKAVEWTDKNRPKDPKLLRFRAEAADLLGVEQKND
jgi:tetratricopeptide (TPR) repeat protein